jgi:hypothetical protein
MQASCAVTNPRQCCLIHVCVHAQEEVGCGRDDTSLHTLLSHFATCPNRPGMAALEVHDPPALPPTPAPHGDSEGGCSSGSSSSSSNGARVVPAPPSAAATIAPPQRLSQQQLLQEVQLVEDGLVAQGVCGGGVGCIEGRCISSRLWRHQHCHDACVTSIHPSIQIDARPAVTHAQTRSVLAAPFLIARADLYAPQFSSCMAACVRLKPIMA